MNNMKTAYVFLVVASLCVSSAQPGSLQNLLDKKTTAKKVTAKESIKKEGKSSTVKNVYRDLKKQLTPKKGGERFTYMLARLTSSLVPITVGAAGVYQALQGNFKTGAALFAGAGGLAFGRAIFLRKMLIADGERYQKKLEEFMAAWPANKHLVPESLQGTFEHFHEVINSDNPEISGTDLSVMLDGMESLALVEKIDKTVAITESKKWSYVEEALAINKPHGFDLKRFAGKVVLRELLMLYGGFLISPLLMLRLPAIRRYTSGLSEPSSAHVLRPTEQEAQRKIDAPALAQEWPNKLFGGAKQAHIARGMNERQAAGISAFVGLYKVLLTLPLIYSLIESGMLARESNHARLAQLDIFMSSWPLIKSYVPEVLHEKFEALYTTKFDLVAHKLQISNGERDAILKSVVGAKAKIALSKKKTVTKKPKVQKGPALKAAPNKKKTMKKKSE
ncbi:MAG: hypothetical protein QG604_682 [Candidatus Dependentiae bacterium]|nr:hypothetical protein [Candidatus Dependentiae bacterium]